MSTHSGIFEVVVRRANGEVESFHVRKLEMILRRSLGKKNGAYTHSSQITNQGEGKGVEARRSFAQSSYPKTFESPHVAVAPVDCIPHLDGGRRRFTEFHL